MNQTEFAKFLDILPNQYNWYENQANQPNLQSAFRICHKLNIKMEELIEYFPEE